MIRRCLCSALILALVVVVSGCEGNSSAAPKNDFGTVKPGTGGSDKDKLVVPPPPPPPK